MSFKEKIINKLPIVRSKALIEFKRMEKEFEKLSKRLDALEKLNKENLQVTKENLQTTKELQRFLRYMRLDNHYCSSLPAEKYEDALKEWYTQNTGRYLNLENPRTFNEKISWLKLYGATPLKTQLADKLLVRDYVKDKIGEKYLIPLLGVWNSFNEIDFNALPDSFALKCTHGSAMNLIVKNKSLLDVKDAEKKFNTWLSTNFAFSAGFEMQYANIFPQIIAEQLISSNETPLYEYQAWCFNGTPQFISVIHDPHGANEKASYSTSWELLPFITSPPRLQERIPCPPFLDELLECTTKLCSGAGSFVRTDFFGLPDGTLKFSEITFTPASGLVAWDPPEKDLAFGKMLTLPKNKQPIPEVLRTTR